MNDLNSPASDIESEAMAEMLFESVSAIISALIDTEKAFLQTNFKRLTDSEEARNNLEKVVPYVYVSALLSLSCKEINDKTLAAVVSSAGIKSDLACASMVSQLWNKSHILYIYAYYFMLALGREDVTSEDLLKVVRGLGNDTDERIAVEALAFVKARERASEAIASMKNKGFEK